MDISDERLGELWRMPDHYMRPISFGRAVALAARVQALEEAAKQCKPWRSPEGIASDIRLLGEDAGRDGNA